MALPLMVEEFRMKPWKLEIPKHDCYLYNFKKMGITGKQFVEIFKGKPAILFEKKIDEKVRAVRCAWCEYNARDKTKYVPKRQFPARRGLILSDHVYTHNKNPVDFQVQKFQKEFYSLRLQYVRMGYHAATCFLVQHQCQICINPKVKGRPFMCSIPESPRNRMRSLKLLGYPIEHLTDLRRVEWSILGVIVLLEV